MDDVCFLGLAVGLWLASIGLAYGCSRLQRLESR